MLKMNKMVDALIFNFVETMEIQWNICNMQFDYFDRKFSSTCGMRLILSICKRFNCGLVNADIVLKSFHFNAVAIIVFVALNVIVQSTYEPNCMVDHCIKSHIYWK